MSKRHAGWTNHYLKKLKPTTHPQSDSGTLRLNSYNTVNGVKKLLMRVNLILNEYTRGTSLRSSLYRFPLFSKFNNLTLNPVYPEGVNSTYIKYLYLLKLLAARSRKARMIARFRPAHGQSTWHNANTVRFCNTFLHEFCSGYEFDLFRRRKKRTFRFTKVWEMRQKSKMKIKKKKKKFTKFKRFGERRLIMKRKKKSPWD